MEKLLSIIAVSALCVVSSHAGREYYFVYEQKNRAEAQSYCREKYTDLATIDNMEDVRILNAMVDLNQLKTSSSRAWIGLYDDVNSWRWSLSNRSFYKPGETEFRNWRGGEPNNYLGEENCVVKEGDGTWDDYICDYPFHAVCMDVRGSSKTYFFTEKAMDWTEAQIYCREHHTDLASVRNLQEVQEMMALTSSQAWIGLHKGTWKWLDGSNSSFRFWNETALEPSSSLQNQRCATVNFANSGKWEPGNCDDTRAFICYNARLVSRVVRMKLETDSSLDLNDPAVMENILKQLKQKLKDKGLNKDIKLSWRKQSDGKTFHKKKKIRTQDDL